MENFFGFLKVEEQRVSNKVFIAFMFIAYLFAIAVRYIWIDWASGFPEFFWHGQIMINTNDGYYWAEGARDILAGFHQPHDLSPVDTPMAMLTAFLAKITPVSFETLILWMPGIFGSLLVVPIMLIARVFKQDILGFCAALLGGIAWSYYNRTMMGYYDSDLLIVVLPSMVIWGSIYAMHKQDDKSLIYAPLFATLAISWHIAGFYMTNGVFLLVLFYTLVFDRKKEFNYKFLALIMLSISAIPFWLKLSLVIVLYIAFVSLKDKINQKTVFIITALIFVVYLLSGGADWLLNILRNGYITRADEISKLHLKYFAVVNTVREAGHIPFKIFADRISGHTVTFWLSVIGYIMFVARYRLFILSLPMVVLGFFAIRGGLRFTVFAVPFMALGASFFIFLVAQYIQNIFGENIRKKARYAFVAIFTAATLYPNITHVQGYKVPTVFTKEEVKVLDKLKSIASREDYVLTWWDYGYPIRYYSDVKTLADGGKHSGSVNFPVSFALTRPQVESSNMARLDTEYTELSYKEDRNGSYVKLMMEDYGFNDPNEFLNSLKNPSFKLPKKSRNVYYYLPLRMLDIFPTVALFSNIDLLSGSIIKRPFFYQSKRFKNTKTKLYLGNNIVLDKKSGYVQIGRQKVPLNSFIIATLTKNGKIELKEQKINSSSSIYLIFMKSYNRFLLLDKDMFNSTYIQLFVLGRYNPKLFEPVIISAMARVYRLKR